MACQNKDSLGKRLLKLELECVRTQTGSSWSTNSCSMNGSTQQIAY